MGRNLRLATDGKGCVAKPKKAGVFCASDLIFVIGRPIELRQLRWTQVFEDRLILEKGKTSQKTGKARIIFLTERVRKMLERLRGSSPYVFLNTHGKPWTMNAVRLQVARLRKA